MSLKEKLRQGNTRRFKTVNVPLWGDVRIRSLTHAEMRALRNSLSDSSGEPIKARVERISELLAVECIVDDKGNPDFTEAEAMSGLFDALDGGAARFLFREISEHTGFLADKDWQAVEEAAKN